MLDFVFKGLGFDAADAAVLGTAKKNVRNKTVGSVSYDRQWEQLSSPVLPAAVSKINDVKQKRVAILEPKNFLELRKAIGFLQTNQPALVSLNNLEDGIRQRGIDFFGGAVFALGGRLEQVSEGLYMFAPEGTVIIN